MWRASSSTCLDSRGWESTGMLRPWRRALCEAGGTRLGIIRAAHVSEQGYRLLGPHDHGLAEAGSYKVIQIRNFDFAGERGDLHDAHFCISISPLSAGL